MKRRLIKSAVLVATGGLLGYYVIGPYLNRKTTK